MKIRTFSLKNHPGLGSVNLSFSDDEGYAYDTVVIAGGNGTGKTTILDVIQQAFDGSMTQENGTVEIGLNLNLAENARLATLPQSEGSSLDNHVMYTVDPQIVSLSNGQSLKYSLPNGGIGKIDVHRFDSKWHGFFKSFLSEAALNFSPGQINGAGGSSIDDKDRYSSRSGEGIASQIAQLIVDINAADAEDLAQWVRLNPGLVPPESVQGRRLAALEEHLIICCPANASRVYQGRAAL